MSIIGRQHPRPYDLAMCKTVTRLLMLAALILMPFGMVGAPAQAQVAHHGLSAASQCPDEPQPQPLPVHKAMDCTATCTALPAGGPAPGAQGSLDKAPLSMAPDQPIAGIILDIATPPPKLG